MRRLRALIRVLVRILTAVPVVASAGQVTGVINWVMVRASDGLTYVSIIGTPTGQPGCATGGYWMIADENSEAGKKQYAMLLEAKATGAAITIYGTNTCTRWPDGENINAVLIAN
jgi:hypothetical protein